MNTRQIAERFRQGKGSCFILRPLMAAALLAAGVISSAQAAPVDGIVRAGSAQISDQGSTTLIQQSSQRAIIDWRSFSISKDELVQFIQPSASSATLNRVTGDQVSLILGRLDANGQVLLLNPNGIILGGGSQINVGSLIASTANLSNDNFMQGKLIFDQPGKPGAGITNAGSITAAEGGLVALVAPHVRNDGLIEARLGKVMLGAADTFTIDLYGDGLVNLALSDASLAQMHDAQGQSVTSLITQAGKIDVGGGQAILVTAEAARGVLDSLINMSGTILADSAVQEGGRILLLAKGGNVDVSGSLSAQGASGGQIEVLGDQVHLASTVQMDASGTYGGGTLHVGGAYQGSGDTYRAQSTQIDAGATLSASAITQGNGGEVVVWSDGSTRYAGSIVARGGAQGGDGGTVEVSGKQTLAFNGYVDAGASNGHAGLLLLDPTNFTIGISEAGLIDMVLRTGTSTAVSASGDIYVNYAIDGRGRLAGGGLTLSAGNNIDVNDFIITNNGAINLFAAAGTVNVAAGKVVYAGNAPITVRSGATLTNAPYLTSGLLSLISRLDSVNIGMGIDRSIGNLFIQAAEDVDIEQPIVSLLDGNSVTVKAGHNVIVNGQIDGRPALNTSPNGSVSITAGQDITLGQSIIAGSIALNAVAGTINAPTMTAGTVTLDADGIPHGVGLFSNAGPISVTTGGYLSSGIYVTTGPVSLRSTGGDVTIDTKLAEILGNVTIKSDTGDVNINQEIANIRSGSNLTVSAGNDINLNRQIDALDDSNPFSIVPVSGGSVTFTAGNDINLNRDLATYNGPVNLTATGGTLNIVWDSADSRTYRISTGSAPISVTAGGNLTTGTLIPTDLTLPDCANSCQLSGSYDGDLVRKYIADQLKPWVAFDTTGKLSLTSTANDVIVTAPIPDTTGEVVITAGDAIAVHGKVFSDDQPITLNAGSGGLVIDEAYVDFGLNKLPGIGLAYLGPSPSIYPGNSTLTLNSVGDISITHNGIGADQTVTVTSTNGKIITGLINNDYRPVNLFLSAKNGIDNFFTATVPHVEADSSNGSINLGVESPTYLRINAALDVTTEGILGQSENHITAGRDIFLGSTDAHNLTMTAGQDAHINYLNTTNLSLTVGRDALFYGVAAPDPAVTEPEATVWNTGSFTVTSTGGDIVFGYHTVAGNWSALHVEGGDLTLNAKNSVTLGLLETLGEVRITAQTGNITLNNDIGPVINGFDDAGLGVASLTLNAGGNINMQGAKAAGSVSITAGGNLVPTKGIFSGIPNGVYISTTGTALEKVDVGPDVTHGPGYTFNGDNFGDIALGTQVKLKPFQPVAPAISPGPSISQPGLPGAITALPAQAPGLNDISGNSVPGGTVVAEAGSSNTENATQTVSGSGGLSEIIPEDEGTTFAGQSEDVVLVFEGGRGVAQTLDVGLGGGQTDVDDTLGGNCAPGSKSKAGCESAY